MAFGRPLSGLSISLPICKIRGLWSLKVLSGANVPEGFKDSDRVRPPTGLGNQGACSTKGALAKSFGHVFVFIKGDDSLLWVAYRIFLWGIILLINKAPLPTATTAPLLQSLGLCVRVCVCPVRQPGEVNDGGEAEGPGCRVLVWQRDRDVGQEP